MIRPTTSSPISDATDVARTSLHTSVPPVSMGVFCAVRQRLADQRHKTRSKSQSSSENSRSYTFSKSRGIEKNAYSKRWGNKFLPPKKRAAMEFKATTLYQRLIKPCNKTNTTSCVSSLPLLSHFSRDVKPNFNDNRLLCSKAITSISDSVSNGEIVNEESTLATPLVTVKSCLKGSDTATPVSRSLGADAEAKPSPHATMKQEVRVKTEFDQTGSLKSMSVKPTKDAINMKKDIQFLSEPILSRAHNSFESVESVDELRAKRDECGLSDEGDKKEKILPNRRYLTVPRTSNLSHVGDKNVSPCGSISHTDLIHNSSKTSSLHEAVDSNKAGTTVPVGTAATGSLSTALQVTCSEPSPFQPTASRTATNKIEAELRGAVIQLCALKDADIATSDQLRRDVCCLEVTSAARGTVLASRAAELLANLLRYRVSRGAGSDVVMGAGRPLHAALRALSFFVKDSAKSRGGSRLTLRDAQRAVHVTEMAMSALTMAVSKGVITKASSLMTVSQSLAAEVRSACQKTSMRRMRQLSFNLPPASEGRTSKWSFQHIRAAFVDVGSLLPLRPAPPMPQLIQEESGSKHSSTVLDVDNLYLPLTPTQQLVQDRASHISVGCSQALFGFLCAVVRRLKNGARQCRGTNSAHAVLPSEEIALQQNQTCGSGLKFRVPMFYMDDEILKSLFLENVSHDKPPHKVSQGGSEGKPVKGKK